MMCVMFSPSSFAFQDTMARLQFLGLFVIIMVCWSGQCVDGQS